MTTETAAPAPLVLPLAVIGELASDNSQHSLAELSAVVSMMASYGSDCMPSWLMLMGMVPWYAVRTNQTIEDVWRAPAVRVIDAMLQSLPAILRTDRFNSAGVDLQIIVELLNEFKVERAKA